MRPTSARPPEGRFEWIGASVARTEDEPLLTGAGRYLADLEPAGCLHAAFVRSPLARARIVELDSAATEAMPGVRAVITGAMVRGLPPLAVNPIVAGLRPFTDPVLAVDRVNAVGMPVALVVAATAHEARRAAEAMAVEYEALDAVADVDAALDPATEPLLEGWPDNVAFEKRWSVGDLDAAMAQAARLVDVRIVCPRVAPLALEPRGLLADWRDGRLTVWVPTQSPHRARSEFARLLDLKKDEVRTIAPDVGGAFGGKASLYPEDVAVAFAAIRLGAPVKWVATRNEEFVSASHGRGGTVFATGAFSARGELLGLRADARFDVGSWATFSAAVPAHNAARILPGPYRGGAIDIVARGVVTNTAAVGIYRGAGRPEAALVMERLMDQAARALGLDPITIRRRNLIPASAFPHATATGQTLDSGDYERLLTQAAALADYEGLRARQRARRERGELVGIGVNLYVEPCGTGWESACIRRRPDGHFTVASGSSAQGQGHRTAYAQIAAQVLGVPLERITVLEGDSDSAPAGIGALASRSMAIGGSAVQRAAEQMRARIAAHGDAMEALEARVVYTADGEAWSSGCCIVTVVIDPATGALQVEEAFWVDDAGLVINPQLVEGQMVGGFAQGLGQALMERIHYDACGQILTGSMMDYAVPRATDVPSLTLASAPAATVTAANTLGAKGVGESGCIAAPAAILNAAIDALGPLGIDELALPLTSESLWRAIRSATPAASPDSPRGTRHEIPAR